jgi:peroxiredoxin
MGAVLKAAAVYNVLWGAWAVLFPGHFWSLVQMPAPNYLFLWQCIGMIVGVYGVGYWVAAGDPMRHWPIVLVGLLGKIFGPIGFLDAWLIKGAVPMRFGSTILTNDLIWWVPFTLILWRAYLTQGARRELTGEPSSVLDVRSALTQAKTQRGVSLTELDTNGGLLVIFLRHAGCTFCRETLADLQRQRGLVEAAGLTPVLVHMGSDEGAAAFFGGYGLGDVARVSDPERRLYRAFELRRGGLGQLFGPRVVLRGFEAAILNRHGVGGLQGDGFQMPGAFVVRGGKIVREVRHRDAADRPDYETLACGVPGAAATV